LENSADPIAPDSQVMVIGDAMVDHQYWIDHMPKAGEDTIILSASENAGGSGANTAIALAYLGVPAKFSGMIGHDRDGDLVLQHMRSVGVDISGIQYGDVTGFTITMIDSSSERTMFSFRGASSNPLLLDEKLLESIKTSRVFLTSGYQLLNREQAMIAITAAEWVRDGGNLVALDPSPLIGELASDIRERILALTDILLPNQHELALLTGESDQTTALEKAKHLCSCVAVKLGSKGSWMSVRQGFQMGDGKRLAEDRVYFSPAVQVEAVDTTGAGDSFNAGFLAAYLHNEKPEDWLRSGNHLAGEVVQHRGAVSMFCSPSKG